MGVYEMRTERILFSILAGFVFFLMGFFTPLQSEYNSLLFHVVYVLSWPIAGALLVYVHKGRLSDPENRRFVGKLSIILLATGYLIGEWFILLSLLFLASFGFFLYALVFSAVKLLKDHKTAQGAA